MACARQAGRPDGPLRRLESMLGFTRTQLLFWVLLGGTAAHFALTRVAEVNIDGVLCKRMIPGECVLFRPGNLHNRIAITTHIGTVLPALLLAFLQFLLPLRRWSSAFHRVNGYIILLLISIGGVSGMLIARDAFGGTLEMQTVMVLSTVMIFGSLGLAMWYIKQRQVDKHRAWMLRAWAIVSQLTTSSPSLEEPTYLHSGIQAGHVITMRLLTKVMVPLAAITAQTRYVVRSCAAVDHMFGSNATTVQNLYPSCSAFYSGEAPNEHVLIPVNIASTRPDHIAANAGIACASAAWVALLLHCVAVEVYVTWTSAETEEQKLGRKRQLDAGMGIRGFNEQTEGCLDHLAPWRIRCKGSMDIAFD